jgi:predicted heme/steroid binding protein
MPTGSKVIIIITIFLVISSAGAADSIKPGLNFLKSAAIPGWGQLSLQKNYGFAFLLAEVSFWSLNFYYNQESDNNAEASFKYAIKYAGIDPLNDYDDDFYLNMRNYCCSGFDEGGYNAHIVSEAIDLYPDDPLLQQQYIAENTYDESKYWNWQSGEHQGRYSSYRRNMDEYSDYMKLVAGVIAANHILSAVDALRLSNHLKKVSFGVDFNSDHTPLITCSYYFK